MILIIDGRRTNDVRVTSDVVYTLEARMGTGGNNVPVIAFDGYNQSAQEDIYRSLRIGIDSGDCIAIPNEGTSEMEVRKLTPLECERLMGWQDNHTLHRADGKENSDTNRYKMCGNGVASPVAQWIGQQLMEIMGDQ